jgi:oligoendopeptidase F
MSVMLQGLPSSLDALLNWTWDEIEPFHQQLLSRPIDKHNVVEWLDDWAALGARVNEAYSRLYVALTVNTADADAKARFERFIEQVLPQARMADQKLKEKLLASGLKPEGYDILLRNMVSEAELFRDANVPLFTTEDKLRTEYDDIAGAQTVDWNGEERTVAQMKPLQFDPDRDTRERAWRLVAERQLQDREAFNALWQRFLPLRREIAANADKADYRDYQWQEKLRFDYSIDDALGFLDAIKTAVVPAAQRIYERRRERLGVDTLRPWDLQVDVANRPPLKPFSDAGTLVQTTGRIFHNVDAALGGDFEVMAGEGLLDLDNRKNKAPGGYCTGFDFSERPFIFMNAVGIHDDVQTLLHEGGHAFHAFAGFTLPPYLRSQPPIEFCEVASMGMELLAGPYLAASKGGFYSEEDAARAFVEHLEGLILFWPYMAVVDAFQHWVYTHADEAMNPANCDATWGRLWDEYMVGIDYSGLEDVKVTGWQRKLHIFQIPFYYIEYGIAQLGAVQVWGNALRDQAQAVADYRRALALGGTKALPDLFAAAGAKLAMDAGTLQQAVDLVEGQIEELEAV